MPTGTLIKDETSYGDLEFKNQETLVKRKVKIEFYSENEILSSSEEYFDLYKKTDQRLDLPYRNHVIWNYIGYSDYDGKIGSYSKLKGSLDDILVTLDQIATARIIN